jgi:hypothetical protein
MAVPFGPGQHPALSREIPEKYLRVSFESGELAMNACRVAPRIPTQVWGKKKGDGSR